MRTEAQKRKKMHSLKLTSHEFRRARTRSMIQIAGLLEKSGILDTFGIQLGIDMQKDPSMKHPVASLFKGLLVLNDMAKSDEVNLSFWAAQGLEALREVNQKK